MFGEKGVKGQVSFEFMVFMGMSILLVIFFLIKTTDRIAELNDNRENVLVNEIAYYVQAELFIAYNAHDGYSRSFELPESIGNKNYSVTYDDHDILFVETDKHMAIRNVPEFSTSIGIRKGTNVIRKTGELIEIN